MQKLKDNIDFKKSNCFIHYKDNTCSCYNKKINPVNLKNNHAIEFVLKKYIKGNESKVIISGICSKLMINTNSLQLTFRDAIYLFTILLQKNKFCLNYLLENLKISPEDKLILQEIKELLLISLYNILKSTSILIDFPSINEYNDFTAKYSILYDENFINSIKALYYMCSIESKVPIFDANSFELFKKNNNFLEFGNKACDTDSTDIVNCEKSEDFKLSHFYEHYFQLVNDFNNLENVNINLKAKIDQLEEKLNHINCNKSVCNTCEKLKGSLQILNEKYNNITKKYSIIQEEKERMVMKYATSEKHVIQVQRSVKLIEKKYQDALKENATLQKKIQKAHDSIVKLTTEINSNSTEILQLRNEKERHKNNDNVKELQLKWSQNRIKYLTDLQKESQIKLDESLIKCSELTNECEQLRSQMKNKLIKVQNTEENKVMILDQQLKEQQARVIMERHIAEDSESSRAKLQKEFNVLLDKQCYVDNENSLLITQIHNLEHECADYKSNYSILNASMLKDKAEIESLRTEISHMETLNEHLKSKDQKISSLETELQRVYIENQELNADIEIYRQRERQMLDFTQKLTDKNVQLQCEFTNMQSKIRFLESNEIPLKQTINTFITEVKNLKYNLSREETRRTQECDLLAKYIAQQALYNQKLFNRLEDVEGENIILRKKYELTMREMTRELQLYHTKVKNVDLFTISSLQKNNNDDTSLNTDGTDPPLVENNKDTKYKIYKSNLEKEELLNQIIKLQKINVQRAEKLDFLEEHSRVLLQELQKRTKIIQDYSLQNSLANDEKF